MSYSNKEVFTLSSVSVIITECLFNIICVFIDTFFVAKLLNYTGYNLFYLGMFYAIMFAVFMVVNLLLNYVMKYIKFNFLVAMGGLLMMVMVLVVFFLNNDQIVSYLPLLSIFYGLGNAFFWAGHNNLSTVAVSSRYQVRFFSAKKSAVILIKMIMPFILGSSISAMGFKTVAIIMTVFTGLLFLFSLFVKANRKIDIKINLFSYLKKIRSDKEKYKLIWRNYLTGFLYGFCLTEFVVLFMYFIVKYFTGADIYLGIIKTGLLALSFINTLLFMKFYRKKRAKYFTFFPMVLVPLAGLFMIFFTNSYTVIIFFAIYDLVVVVLESLADMRRAGIIRLLSMHDDVVEHNAVYQTVLCFSRTIGFTLLMLVGLIGSETLFFVLIGFFLINFILLCISTYKTEKLLVEQDKTWHIENHIENK